MLITKDLQVIFGWRQNTETKPFQALIQHLVMVIYSLNLRMIITYSVEITSYIVTKQHLMFQVIGLKNEELIENACETLSKLRPQVYDKKPDM